MESSMLSEEKSGQKCRKFCEIKGNLAVQSATETKRVFCKDPIKWYIGKTLIKQSKVTGL